jgi:AcrR family transcriptional regulator
MGETDDDMARTRDDQGRRILEAASELLSQEGAGALSVRRIASAAGCSTMGLYSRFGSKDGVVDELFAEGFEHLCQAMSALPTTADAVADLRACAVTYRESSLAQATHYMVMFGGAVPGFVPSEESHAIAHEAFARLVARVQRCVDDGSFGGDAVDIAEVVWGSIHGLVMLELVGIDPAGTDAPARYARALDILFAGLRQRAEAGHRH